MTMKFKDWMVENFHDAAIFINTARGKETYPVPSLVAYAQRHMRPQQVTIDWLKANINGSGRNNIHSEPEEGEDHDRSGRSDLQYPILIIKEPHEMWIGDGNHRIYKAMHIARVPSLPAYIIYAQTLPPPDQLADI
jgi:hypothetical protein